MMTERFRLAVMAMAVACAAAVHADDAGPANHLSFGLIWENDSSTLKPNHNTDRFYTNGTVLFLAGQPEWIQGVDLLPWDTDGDSYAIGGVFGQQMFTPGDIRVATPQPDDHPWAGYLYGGVYWQRQNGETFDHLQLDIGVVGPASQADHTQAWFHRTVNADDPRGWKNQLHNEYTAQLYYRKKWRLSPEAWSRNFDVIPSAGLALGSVHRYIEGSVTARLGINLPDDFGPARIADLGAATGSVRRGFSVYAFGRAGGRIVEHNLFIEGNNFQSSPGVPAENLVGELHAGIVGAYRWNGGALEVGYAQTLVTPEFGQQATNHTFGAISVTLNLSF